MQAPRSHRSRVGPNAHLWGYLKAAAQDCPSSSMLMCARFIKVLSLSIKSLCEGEVAKQRGECTVPAFMRKSEVWNIPPFIYFYFSIWAAGMPRPWAFCQRCCTRSWLQRWPVHLFWVPAWVPTDRSPRPDMSARNQQELGSPIAQVWRYGFGITLRAPCLARWGKKRPQLSVLVAFSVIVLWLGWKFLWKQKHCWRRAGIECFA